MREHYRNGWTVWHLLTAAVIAATCVLITGNAWADMFHIASLDEESSHVLIVPLVVVWLLWVRRSRFRVCAPGGRILGVGFLACGWLLWSLGYREQVQSFWHLGAVVLTVGGILVVVGEDIFWNFVPAFAVLVFLVPVPATGRQWIALPLQHATAQVTQSIGEVLGMTVERHANLLIVNGTEVAIAEACNGMRQVFTLFLGCYVFAFVTPLRGYVRFIVLALSPVTAIVANVVRLVPTMYVFGNYPTEVAERFHDVSGWLMLLVAFLGLMGIVKLLRWALVPVGYYTLAAAG